MIKKYLFDYAGGEADASFHVDTRVFTVEMALATLNFFTWKWDKENDPIDEVMKKYAMAVIRFATLNNYSTQGVLQNFDTEGYGPIDGSIGVKLLSVSLYEFSDNELEMIIN